MSVVESLPSEVTFKFAVAGMAEEKDGCVTLLPSLEFTSSRNLLV